MKKTKIISITSGKGGMGKTTIVANVATLLAKAGKKVLVVDADLGLANIHIILGLIPSMDLRHAILEKVPLEKVVIKAEQGFNVIPASSGILEMANLPPSEVDSFLKALESLAEGYEYMLIDIASGLSISAVSITLFAPNIYVILGPDPASFADAYAVVKTLTHADSGRPFGIILNFVNSEDQARDMFRRFKLVSDRFLSTELKYIGSILLDERLRKSALSQRLVVDAYPSSKASRSLYKLAKKIVDESI